MRRDAVAWRRAWRTRSAPMARAIRNCWRDRTRRGARLAFESAAGAIPKRTRRRPGGSDRAPPTLPQSRAAPGGSARSFDLRRRDRVVERREARVLKPAAAPARVRRAARGATIVPRRRVWLLPFGAPSIAPVLRSHASIHDALVGCAMASSPTAGARSRSSTSLPRILHAASFVAAPNRGPLAKLPRRCPGRQFFRVGGLCSSS